jgi:hypothetical protein
MYTIINHVLLNLMQHRTSDMQYSITAQETSHISKKQTEQVVTLKNPPRSTPIFTKSCCIQCTGENLGTEQNFLPHPYEKWVKLVPTKSGPIASIGCPNKSTQSFRSLIFCEPWNIFLELNR